MTFGSLNSIKRYFTSHNGPMTLDKGPQDKRIGLDLDLAGASGPASNDIRSLNLKNKG